MRAWLRELIEGDTARARSFRYGLLAFDLVTILYVVATSFIPPAPVLDSIDAVIGVFLLAEFAARMYAARELKRELLHPATLADVAAIGSFIAPITGEGLGFLRVLRTLRLIHSPMLLKRLRADLDVFRRSEDVIVAATDMFVFVFAMTGLVYLSQHGINPGINSYADSLYFTITALTTTGFGDITPHDTLGRLLTVVIMVCGVTLFLRLAQALFRPAKVRFECPACALMRHDTDAVHCKACGVVLRIPDEGDG